jgi:ribosomal protein S18 acetylase RimI-like enzyme
LRALKSTPTAFLISFDEEKANGSTHFLKSLSHKGNDRAIFGAFEGQEIIGTIGVYKEDHHKISHKATIWGMHVDEDHRGKGIGRQLVDTALKFAKKDMAVISVSLSVESNNQAAKKLYLAKGFKCWGVEPRAMNNDGLLLDEDHMVILFEK